MTNIYLTGKLGKLFGEKWTLEVQSPAEALHAININTKGKFSEYLEKNKNKYYKIGLQNKKQLITAEEIKIKTGKNDIYIMPTIKGSNSGAGKILAGIVLLVAAYFTGGTALAFLQVPLASAGASLVLGGIVQLLTPVPNFDNNSGGNEDGRQSTLFQGNASTIFQGGAVGLIYGRALVAPMPISLSINNNDTDATASTTVGSVEQRDLNGGGYEYIPGVSEQY
jgi:predicted phage tail protein